MWQGKERQERDFFFKAAMLAIDVTSKEKLAELRRQLREEGIAKGVHEALVNLDILELFEVAYDMVAKAKGKPLANEHRMGTITLPDGTTEEGMITDEFWPAETAKAINGVRIAMINGFKQDKINNNWVIRFPDNPDLHRAAHTVMKYCNRLFDEEQWHEGNVEVDYENFSITVANEVYAIFQHIARSQPNKGSSR